MLDVEETIYIHAAPATTWAVFARLEEWPSWNTEILAAEWSDGSAWEENSRLRLHHRSLFGATTTTEAVLKMVIPTQVAVWESQSQGMTVVNSARFEPSTGGCRLTARHAYHGTPALLVRLLKGRQQRTLKRAMEQLKAAVEESIQARR